MNFDDNTSVQRVEDDDNRDAKSKPAARRSKVAIWTSILVLLGILGGGGYLGYGLLKNFIASVTIEDYSGQAGPPVEITIEVGDTGEDVARKLVAADVIKSFDAIYRPMLASDFSAIPGTYSLPTRISGVAALDLLISGDARVVNQVTIQEGLRAAQILEKLASSLNLQVADLEAATSDLEKLGLPEDAPNIEGWLFPATYKFDPGVTAGEVIRVMVNRTLDELIEFGVPENSWHETLTMASIVQVEGKPRDFAKVARVFFNRIEIGMLLQSDATVSYATDGTTVTTTDEQRATDSPYNTYYYAGLPLGPINSPGADAIRATLNPEPGEWLYFVTINLETGETVFTNTYAEHLVEVEKFQAWIREHPEWND